MRNLKYLIIIVLLFVILRLIFISSFWLRLEYSFSDLLFNLRGARAISDEIVIVEIGDDTFNALNERWPFPREYYARIISNLEKAGAKQIVFDIEFIEKSFPAQDKLLAETAARYDNIIFAGKHIREKDDRVQKQQILPPITEITERGLPWGTVNISLDQDGFVRRYQLLQSFNKKHSYSIGVLSIAFLHGDPNWEQSVVNGKKFFHIRDKNIPKVTSSSCLINFYGPVHTFRYYDFADVLDDSTFIMPADYDLNTYELFLEENTFRDKIVLIGTTADDFHDSHNTPFSLQSTSLTPGVEIHANFIEMVLNDNYLKRFSHGLYLLFYLLLLCLILLMNIKLKPIISLIVNGILLISYLVMVYVLFVSSSMILPLLEVPALIVVLYIIGLIIQYVKTFRERHFIKQAFKQYMAPELVNELLRHPNKLEYGGTQREISVLFADLRAFTPYTESHSPRETVAFLKEYLTCMVTEISKCRGTIDKFVGDSIIAIFGDPVELDNHAYRACQAAMCMRKKYEELKQKWQEEKKEILEMGIGINSGIATVGNLGSEQIFDYTAIGDTMNTGARIEDLNKVYSTSNHIIISESTWKLAGENIQASYLDEVRLKGKAGLIKIYALDDVGSCDEMTEEEIE
ncbi:MAG: adenylate/guanylate cyclase domain-containing protein [Candidatus Cloacimonetes bacterium]|nr:adenylate/guanylate cyclase domain-containing protein [Candidatus Cloacimonadota bacterium]